MDKDLEDYAVTIRPESAPKSALSQSVPTEDPNRVTFFGGNDDLPPWPPAGAFGMGVITFGKKQRTQAKQARKQSTQAKQARKQSTQADELKELARLQAKYAK